MINSDLNLVECILTVKASGTELEAHHDLSLPEGKSIAQLLYDQETIQNPEKTDQ